VTSVGGVLKIQYNAALTNCCGIQDLLSSSGVSGSIKIHDNPSECSNEAEILAADCVVGLLSPKINTASLMLSPNPAYDAIRLSLTPEIKEQNAHLLIVNPLGQVILEKNDFKNNDEINIHHFPKGNYFVRLVTNAATYSARFVKN